ncbi:MAG: response regulator transcription factor [Actinomycetota bacterium]|jgi:DNA-binding NarL/FixJ family response regulator|nr:MAG: response regulator receiver [Acidimicrobiaceae bacterium]
MIRIVVVDDHSLVRTGLQQWLSSHSDLDVVGVASDGEQAVEMVLELLPDVVIMDVAMPVLDGISAMAAIAEKASGISIIALSTFHDQAQINAALDAGAVGYLLKDVNPEVLVAGIRSVVQGGMALSPIVAAQLFHRGRDQPVHASTLTPREREILLLIAGGHGNKQIARLLDISDKTVKSHCGRLFQRIGVSDRTQAAIWAIKNLPAAERERVSSANQLA